MHDYLALSPIVEEATRKAQDLGKMSTISGFTPTKIASNFRGVLLTLNLMENRTHASVKAFESEDESSHVLGVKMELPVWHLSCQLWNRLLPLRNPKSCTQSYFDRARFHRTSRIIYR